MIERIREMRCVVVCCNVWGGRLGGVVSGYRLPLIFLKEIGGKMKLIVFCILIMLLPSCGYVTRQIVGTQDPAPKQRVLTFQKEITAEGLKFYESALTKIVEKEDEGDNKSILKLAHLVDDELRRKSKAGEKDKIALVGNTLVRIMAEPEIRKKVEEGFQFGMNALTMALSGGIGGTSIIGGLFAGSKIRNRRKTKKNEERINYEVLKNKIKTEVLNEHPEILAEVNEAAKHTIAEGSIT